MTHPEFNSESSCGNCAAFDGHTPDDTPTTRPARKIGTCHRHAPRVATRWAIYNTRKDCQVYAIEQAYGGVVWPVITDDDAMFCCEWLPKPLAPDGGTA